MMNTVYNTKDLIFGVHECLTEWLKGHSYVCFDTQVLVDAWSLFRTEDETTMKLFYWFHKHNRFDAILAFETEVVLRRKKVAEVPDKEMAKYDFPPMHVIRQFWKSWVNNRIINLQKNVDDKMMMMMSWSVFDLHNDHILKTYAKVFASGNIADVAKFEEQNFVNSQFRLEGWDITLDDELKTKDEIPPLRSIVDKVVDIRHQPIDTEAVEISDENVKKLFSAFLTKMRNKNEQLKKYLQFDDKIRLQEDMIKTTSASGSSKSVIPKIFGFPSSDKATQTGESEETVQNQLMEQSVDAHQNRTYSEVAKPEEKEGAEAEVSEEKILAPRFPKFGKGRSNFQLTKEGSAEVPKVDEWVKAKKVLKTELDPSRIRAALAIAKYLEKPLKEEEKKGTPAETANTSKPVATVKVGLTPQEMKAAKDEKKNLKKLEKNRREKEEQEAFANAETAKIQWRQEKSSELHVTRFQQKLEDFQKTSQNLTDDLASKLATRFIERRVEVLSQSMRNNENSAQQNLFLYFYKVIQNMGLSSLDKEHLDQLCMLNKNYKNENFGGLEHVFHNNKELGEKMGEHIRTARRRIDEDPVAARQVFDTFYFGYVSNSVNSDVKVNRTNAKLYLDTRINLLSETSEGSTQDSDTLKAYQAVSARDFDTIPLEILQQMSMLNKHIDTAEFPKLEPILMENLKAII